MISDKKIECPQNLLNLAKMAKPQRAAIISAGNTLAMESALEASKLSLIEPVFIGDKEKIEKEAEILKWNISDFEIIDEKIENNTALHGAKMASEGKVKILIKGHIHTDILMKSILKKILTLLAQKD